MDDNPNIHTVRVFVDEKGQFGNPVGIILDEENNIDKKECQKLATKLGYSESVFINDLNAGRVSIFNPQHEVVFAGHAMVGTAWLINKLKNQAINSLECAGGSIKTWRENDLIWIRADLKMMPPWKFEQLNSAAEVERLSHQAASRKKHTFVWAWKEKGLIRARTFAPDWGIPEDQANGSGSMKLAANLRANIEVKHGKGSVIYAKPWESDFADLGGRVAEDKVPQ